MMDNELFGLCKEVYGATEWGLHIADQQLASYEKYIWFYRDDGLITDEPIYNTSFQNPTPLYTSDYLLEKLPKERGDEERTYLTLDINPFGDWSAYYSDGQGGSSIYIGIHNTALKALLKLTLALHAAGELK
ncbi:hypothetical protein E3O62_02565 [Cryobacterium sp. TMT2-15-1]|uniref:hypothetical protein n=1 Tax=Cryobacterium sp. TMT2-15-1 TaxID=1259246 RepID=UPI00106C8C2D|nr:hypothetical protein [Cryobacterium sp. TMT2-15-1]TFC63728.1 hypothetical protein E3O62_02565 [Cryobacterium sp. TMT2-15-1]